MAELSNTLYTAGEYLVLANTDPYLCILEATGVDECFINNGVGTILKKEFRYSTDNITFSEFQEITIENLANIGSLEKAWFQFRYILLSGGPVTIEKASLKFTPQPNDPYAGYVAPNINDDSTVYAFPITYKSNFSWEPYKMNKAVRLYKDLNLMVNNLFGHETTYYKANPHRRSKDVFLMEHSLFEHEEGQCVKVVVPNNEFPDNKLNMGPFGQDFELPFEVQVDKDYFQQIFGDGSGPQKRDVIYFPRTSRIYEVSSSYLFRDFMNEPLYFKITLIKWLPKSNVNQSETLDNLESYTVSATNLFSEEIANEEVKVTNPQQFEISTTKEDPVREYLSAKQNIKEENLVNYHTIISEFHYQMEALANSSMFTIGITADSLTIDTEYYARLSPESVLPDAQQYYSMKKLTYLGKSDNRAIFSYKAGTSQIQDQVDASQIFKLGSPYYLYESDYILGATVSDHIISCDVDDTETYYTDKVAQYKNTSSFPVDQDRSYSAWFRLKDSTFPKVRLTSLSYDIYTRDISITLANKSLFFVGDTVELFRVSNSNFLLFGKVKTVTDQTHIIVTIDQYSIDFIQSSYSSWTGYTDIQVQKTLPRIFLSSLHNDKGIKIELYGKRHFKVTTNLEYKFFSIPNDGSNLENVSWYALFINFSNMFKQLTLNLWKLQWNSTTNLPATTDLSLILNKTVQLNKEDRSSDIKYYLDPSFMDLTNIRVFSRVAETDKQTIILNQNIVKDAHLAIVIDNALPQSHLPYIGYTR